MSRRPSPRTQRPRSNIACLALACLLTALGSFTRAGEADCFRIQVVDAETGRGVPLVELRTVNDLRFFTDSQGVLAFDEPGLLGQEVYFHIKSHGYEVPKDGFGFRGKAFQTSAGGSAKFAIQRVNIAQRLYRITGAGIYGESLKAGMKTPTQKPVLNGQVLGSDTVLNVPYRGKMFWVWGDTNRPQYPLGNFQTPAGTSEMPPAGLDPDVGIDLTYYVDDKGFARGMCAMPGSGPTWVESLVNLREEGRERLFAGYVKVKPPLDIYAHGLAEYQPEAEKFEPLVKFDENAPLYPSGHAFLHKDAGVEYVYFAKPFPLVRVRATSADLKDLTKYQGYTCLEEGSKLDAKNPAPHLARVDGRASYAWRTNTPVVPQEIETRLVKEGKLKAEEALVPLRSASDGKTVQAHYGSTAFNAWRGRWMSIFVEQGGASSQLGEVWYAEADTLAGPWAYAVKIATHEKYTFYNPKHHPWFDKENGRVIYFEGTYTNTFSGNPDQTPRYDYNQMMYKLDLADPRTAIPVPVYTMKDGGKVRLTTLAGRAKGVEKVGGDADGTKQGEIPFFALDRPVPGCVPVFADLTTGPVVQRGAEADAKTIFYALPAGDSGPAVTALLFGYMAEDGSRGAAIEGREPRGSKPRGSKRSEKPIARVWLNPNAGR